MSTAFRRKTYGPVKPVKKAKPEPPPKPSTMALHSLLRTISKSSPGKHIDSLSHALYWWDGAVTYIKHKRKITPIASERQLLEAFTWRRKGQAAKTNDEKERCFIGAMQAYRAFAKGVIDVDDAAPYLAKYKESSKKMKAVAQKIAPRFDPFLDKLSACFGSCQISLRVLPDINGDRSPKRSFDHDLGRMIYTRQLALKLMKQLRTEGLLSVVVEEARHLSRAMAFVGTLQGAFIVDHSKQLLAYMQLMSDFVEFAASHPDAPNRLVKRTTPPSKKRVGGRTKKVKVDVFGKGVMSELLDQMTEKSIKAVYPKEGALNA